LSGGELATTQPPGGAQVHNPPKSSTGALAAVTPRATKKGFTKIAANRFDPALLKQRPKRLAYPLEKVLGKSRSYANQIVIPAGMYQLERSPSDRALGKRTFFATERKIESRRDNSLGMSSGDSAELEVDPYLAERLDNLDADHRNDKVAILTLWFTADARPVLVKVEILLRYVTGFKRGTVYPQGDVDYETLVVSPEKSERIKARDEDWEEPGRMLHFANHYKREVARYKKMLLSNEHAQLNSIMATMWGNMMRNAANEAAQQRQLQRAISGR
jgi:hypothetical protein